MNQKRITNQILEQKNYTLNSTLNYLFNISNMKKLFSYLLISSMVVLSSCTNYDDQFDDLNTQINTLKSQIEGFSSLSSGLTALQGTVASLQTAINAIEIPAATDVSGLATAANLATLSTALTTLAADVKELQDTLATAATAAEVAAPQTALTAAQADLTNLLAANNIYSTAVSITDDATLDFADALGTKLSIVNNSITITQTKEMDAVKLQTVMDRIKTATGSVTFTSILDATTVPAFNNLTSVTGVFTLNQKADVSLPKLKTASTLTITDNNKVTSVSAPVLETYSTLGTTSHAKVANYSMPMLKRFSESQNSGDFTLTVKSGTVDFSSVVTLSTAATPLERADDITINGATIVKAPKIVSGKLTMNSVEEPNFPVWEGTTDSAFDKAKKVVLPSITGDVQVNLSTFAKKATYFHMIGAEFNPPNDSSKDSKFPTFNAGTNNSVIETLILDGVIKTVTVNGASDLTSYTHTGKTHDVDFINNDSMTSVTFGHTTTLNTGAKGVAVTYGTLEVSENAEITSVSAPELDDIKSLDISDNDELTTLSFPKLNSLGSNSDGKAVTLVTVDIYSNALGVQNVQLASPANYTPAVSGKVTTNSGITGLKTYLDAAIASTDDVITVKFDTVDKITDHLGVETTADTSPSFKTTGITATTNDARIDAAATSDAWVFIQTDKGIKAIANSATDYEAQSAYIALEVQGTNLTYKPLGTAESVNIAVGGVTKEFGEALADGSLATITAVKDAIKVYDFGSTTVDVSAQLDAGQKSYNRIIYNKLSTGTESTIVAQGSLTWQLGSSKTASGTIVVGTSSTVAQIQTALVTEIGLQALEGAYSYAATNETISDIPYMVLTREVTGTNTGDLGKDVTYPTISILVTDTIGYAQFGATMSNVAATDYSLDITQKNVAGLRVTFTSTTLTSALSAADTVTITPISGGVMSDTTVTLLVSGTNITGNKTVQLNYTDSTAYTDGNNGGTAAAAIDATAWL